MKIQDFINPLEKLANPRLQEGYDNAGLIVGNRADDCSGVLISLDTTERVVEEAIAKNCNLIVSHHPIVFKGVKRLTGANYVERTLIKAIKNDIAIYAIHTNLDNVLHGVNGHLAKLLQLKNVRVLSEKKATLKHLITFVPVEYAEKVRSALFENGAGNIGNYSEASFNVEGEGTYKALEGAQPFLGEIGSRHMEKEVRIEVIYPFYSEGKIVRALKEAHPYEEVAYFISELENTESSTGSGLIGELEEEITELELLINVKNVLKSKCLKHTPLLNRPVKKVAICGGSGFFLLPNAIAAGADAYLTADIKYHEFFDADGKILLIDGGHYETEQYTINLLYEYLKNIFSTFAILKTECMTNPVQYYIG